MPMNQTPYFSVVIPTYNRVSYIKDAINSVLRQSFYDLEIIIVDDGSIDDTHEVIEQVYSGLGNIRYIYQQNSERGAARNNGWRQALGRYVCFMDSDDMFSEEHLSVLYEYTQRFPDINIFSTKIKVLNKAKCYTDTFLKEGFYDLDYVIKGSPFGCNVCIKKEASNLLLFPEERELAIMEDWLFLVRNLVRDKIYLINKYTLFMRFHVEQSMQENNKLVIERRLNARKWILANIPLSAERERKLHWHTYFFCAIHSYLENSRGQALDYLYECLKMDGRNFYNLKLWILMVKVMAGRKTILKIRKIFKID